MITAFIGVVLSITLNILIITFATQAQSAIIQDARDRVGGVDAFISGIITPEYVQAIREIDGVEQALAIHQGHFDVQSGYNPARQLRVYTIGTENSPIARRRYGYDAIIAEGQTVISSTVSEFLEVDVGRYIIIEDKKLEVIEVIERPHEHLHDFELVVIYFEDFSRFIGSENSNYMAVEFLNPRNAFEIHSHIRGLDANMIITLLADALDDAENLSSLQIYTYIFSSIVILACVLMVISNFQSFIEGYKRQFSIMRSFGAFGSQLKKILFVQGSIIVGSGTIVGILLALVLYTIVFRLFSNVFSLAVTVPLSFPIMFLVAFISFIIVLGALFIPAIQCGRSLPLQIARDVDNGLEQGKWQKVLGIGFLAISALLFLFSGIELLRGSQSSGPGGAVIVFFIPGFLLLFPSLIYLCLNTVQKMLRKVSKGTVDIAISNMKSNLTVTKNIVLSISFIFIITIFGSVIFRTIHSNVIGHLESNHFLDITVSDINMFNSQLDRQFLDELNAIESPDNTVAFSYDLAFLLTNNVHSMHYDAAFMSLSSLIALGELNMEVNNTYDVVVLTRSFATLHNFTIGDTLILWYNPNLTRSSTDSILPITESFVFFVGAVVDELYFVPPHIDMFIDWNNKVFLPSDFIFHQAFIRTTDIDKTISSLYALRNKYPEIRWSTLESALEWNNSMFRERFGMFILVLILVIVALCLGVINSVFEGIYRRRKEYAVLRVIGVEQKTIARTVYLQICLYMFIGVVMGVGVGSLLSFIFVVMVERIAITIDPILPVSSFFVVSFILALAIRPRLAKILKEDMLIQISD